jgi:protein TonB
MSTEKELPLEAANDRIKRDFPAWFWSSVIAASVFHVAVIGLAPTLQADDVGFSMDSMMAIEMPPEVEIPPPPEAIHRPANPVVSQTQIDLNVTISEMDFESTLPPNLPSAPVGQTPVDISANPTITPYEVRPEVRNPDAVIAALGREYPPSLKDERIGGTVIMHMFITETGTVERCLVATTSGYALLDAAGEKVCSVFNFVPAQNMGRAVPVWVQIPITFNAR